jgi:hypothetical protein
MPSPRILLLKLQEHVNLILGQLLTPLQQPMLPQRFHTQRLLEGSQRLLSNRLFLKLELIVPANPNQSQQITNHHRLYPFIKDTRRGQRRLDIHFQNPRLHILVDHHIEPVQFETVIAGGGVFHHILRDGWFYRD